MLFKSCSYYLYRVYYNNIILRSVKSHLKLNNIPHNIVPILYFVCRLRLTCRQLLYVTYYLFLILKMSKALKNIVCYFE